MTNSNRLRKAIEKAEKNGYEIKWNEVYDLFHRNYAIIYSALTHNFYGQKINQYGNKETTNWFSAIDIIFDIDFAKGLWGEEKICRDGTTYQEYLSQSLDAGLTIDEANDEWERDEECIIIPMWQYHQHKMLDTIQAGYEPLKYLEIFL